MSDIVIQIPAGKKSLFEPTHHTGGAKEMTKRINSRQKGKAGELAAVKFLKSLGFTDARRTAQHSGKDGGPSDVVCPDSLPNVHIEVKVVKAMGVTSKLLRDALAQATRDSIQAGGEKAPVVLWKPHGTSTWVLSEWQGLGEGHFTGNKGIRARLTLANNHPDKVHAMAAERLAAEADQESEE